MRVVYPRRWTGLPTRIGSDVRMEVSCMAHNNVFAGRCNRAKLTNIWLLSAIYRKLMVSYDPTPIGASNTNASSGVGGGVRNG